MKGKIYNEETGKWISGGAAQLHTIKKAGGWNNFIGDIVTETAKATVREAFRELDSRGMDSREIKNSKPRFKRVK